MFKFTLRTLFLFTAFSLSIFSPTAQAVDKEVYEKLNILANVFERIRSSYVEDITETEVIESAINGMLTSLDPHSGYLTQDDFKGMQEQTRGEFGGLGIEVTMENGVVKVVSPIEDTPAYQAGVEAGDYIIRIDDEDVQGLTLSEAVDRMRGKVGTDITIKVYRESERRSFDITITRAVIQIKPVKSRLHENGIGYLRITTFNEHVERQINEHIKDMVKENGGKALSGLVLDLRNNPGGLLNQAVAAADAFLEQGEIVSTRGKLEGQNSRFNARSGDVLNGAPMVVLINTGSASASEIVAGALQDHKRAVVMGTQSFGKGSVQTIMPLPGGAGMRLTTALYYTPAGTSIQAKGITPDIEVKRAKLEEIDESEFSRTEADLKNHLQEVLESTKEKDAESKKNAADKEAEERIRKDYQLQRALGVVRALSLMQAK